MWCTRVVLPVLLLLAPSTGAEETRPLEPGERIRLKAPSIAKAEIHGRVVGIDGSTLVLDAEARPSTWERIFDVPIGSKPPGRLYVPLRSVTSLEVARGKKSNWLAAFGAGAAVAGLAVLLAGFSYGTAAACGIDESCPEESSVVALAAGVGVATALGVGLFAKTDRWVDVTPARARLTIAPVTGRGVAVALSVRF
jgi:hypothetical protein